MSIPHVWNPSDTTRAAGESATVTYLYAAYTAPGEQRAIWPALEAFSHAIVMVWPGVSSGGMRRDSRRIGAESHDPHRDGIAVDFQIRPGPERNAQGDALANWLVEHATMLGIQYVFWAGYEWSASGLGPRWEARPENAEHGDHVHVELGADSRLWPAAFMRERVETALREPEVAAQAASARKVAVVATGAVVVAAALAAIFWDDIFHPASGRRGGG